MSKPSPNLDGRAVALPTEALLCRSSGRHRWPTIAEAADQATYGPGNTTMIPLRCACGATKLDAYSLADGRRVPELCETLKYPTDDNGNSLYLMPSGTGRLSADDARVVVFSRLTFRRGGK